ncbi:MAG: STAS domain-containing protein [Cellvibrio sp.]|uniref:STAS domain-containing protein n=1 Tax=Cellvibrio sp. TaxID=1965322 RepID=UPI002718D5EE|nr:STAS domain-containing protein [Cellvibrio sp.]
MRNHVPFVGERKVVRADDEPARAKRASGRVIDDVVGDGPQESSWDDTVPGGWLDKSKPNPTIKAEPQARASVAMPRGHVPLRSGAKTAGATTPAKKGASSKPSASSSAISFSDAANMDWVHINNGRGLRVSIHGNIDNDLRKEWSRLLNDTESAHIKEFEFNLSETPALSLTGLGMLLLFKERKGSKRDDIRLCNCNKDVTQLLHWTGMDKYFLIQNTQISEIK